MQHIRLYARKSCICGRREYAWSMPASSDSEPLQPNHALRQVREAMDFTQSSFANRVDFATALVQAVELGQRSPSDEFVRRVTMTTGVWPACVKEKWPVAVDFNGELYTAKTFRRFRAGGGYPEQVNSEDIDALLAPAKRLLLAAAKVGKTRMAAFYLRQGLIEATENVFRLAHRISTIMRSEESQFGKLTVGELRANPQLAAAVGFKDDPRRAAEEVIVLQAERDLQSTAADFYPTTLVPDEQEMARAYSEYPPIRTRSNTAEQPAPDVVQPSPPQTPQTSVQSSEDPGNKPGKQTVRTTKRKPRRSSTDTSVKH